MRLPFALFVLLSLLPLSWGAIEMVEESTIPRPSGTNQFGYFTSLDGNLLAVGTLDSQYIYFVNSTYSLIHSLENSGYNVVQVAGDFVAISEFGTGLLSFFHCNSSACVSAGQFGGPGFYDFLQMAGSGSFFAVPSSQGSGLDVDLYHCTAGTCSLHSTVTTHTSLSAMSMKGNYLAIYSGVFVELFEYSSSWSLLYEVDIESTGDSVAIDFPLLAVGDYLFNSNQGRLIVYTCDGSSCTQLDIIMGSDVALINFGYVVQLSGSRLLVAAPDHTSFDGRVYLYTCTSSCDLQDTIDYSAVDGSASFAYSLSVSNHRFVVSAPYAETNQGLAFSYGLYYSDATCEEEVLPSGTWPETPAGEMALVNCTSGYYSTGTPARACDSVPGPVGSWGVISDACEECGCSEGSISSACNSTGGCTCQAGFEGLKCDECLPGHYDNLCLACPDCQNGTCLDGISGNGSCSCSTGWAISDSDGCDTCSAGYFGVDCAGLCPVTCNNGDCSEGLFGSGECVCETGWEDSNDTVCSQCESGFAMVLENCEPCHPSCLTCSGDFSNECLTCESNLIFNPANNSCISSCDDGFYANSSVCTPCDDSCLTCLSGLSTGCTTCDGDKVLDSGSCLSSCQTPQTFNNSGVCSACSTHCQTCQGAAATECLTCTDDYLLDFDGSCVESCQQPNYFIEDSVCQPCHGNCSTCEGAGEDQCLTCPLSMNLAGGTCVETCPDGYFPQTQICTRVFCDEDAQPSGTWPATNTGETAFMNCTSGYYSTGTPSRVCNFVSGPNGSWGAISDACEECECGAGSSSSACNSTGGCTCQAGFEGLKCDECLPGHYGNLCVACPDCQNGTCLDGVSGDGSCSCSTGWAILDSDGCDTCSAGYFGVDCAGLCPITCNNGTCSEGLFGSGECVCETGWEDNGATECSKCQSGFAMVAGDCVTCHSSCLTCKSGLSSGCTSCDNNKVLDSGSCVSSCRTPQTFENDGVCSKCSALCETCEGAGATDCLTCVQDYELSSDGSCVLGQQNVGLSPGGQAGIAIAVILVVLAACIGGYFLYRKRSHHKKMEESFALEVETID